HNRTGGETQDIFGTYGFELVVDGPGSLTDFTNETSLGEWKIRVSDQETGPGNTWGMLRLWRVAVWGSAP
ncbi:hypothetical protein KAW64_16860, partial [bacterium]|nr:hypothetical protein [bacterium]